MAEYITELNQTVTAGNNVLFANSVFCRNCNILHRDGSGLFKLKGVSNSKSRFKISFNGNLAITTGGTIGAVSLAVANDGETLTGTTMTVTPAAASEYFNVACSTFIDIPCGCCSTIAIKNITNQSVEVQNANLLIERVA